MKAYEKLQEFMREKHHQRDWEGAWKSLANATEGISRNNQRFILIMRTLEDCDRHFYEGNWTSFQESATRAKNLCDKAKRTEVKHERRAG